MGNCSDELHAANNHQVCTAGERGNVITKILRSSVDKPRMTKTISAPALVLSASFACTKDVGTAGVKAWVAPPPKVQAKSSSAQPVAKLCVDACKRWALLL